MMYNVIINGYGIYIPLLKQLATVRFTRRIHMHACIDSTN